MSERAGAAEAEGEGAPGALHRGALPWAWAVREPLGGCWCRRGVGEAASELGALLEREVWPPLRPGRPLSGAQGP